MTRASRVAAVPAGSTAMIAACIVGDTRTVAWYCTTTAASSRGAGVFVGAGVVAAGAAMAGAMSGAMPTGAVGTKFSALPEAVQKTIQAHAPETSIADISRETDNGRTVYEVSFQDTGKNPSIKVAEDGTLVQNLQK